MRNVPPAVPGVHVRAVVQEQLYDRDVTIVEDSAERDSTIVERGAGSIALRGQSEKML
jgi:hypothetical protein